MDLRPTQHPHRVPLGSSPGRRNRGPAAWPKVLSLVALGALLALAVWGSGCTFDRSGLGECRSDPDCPGGASCVNGSCVAFGDTGQGPADLGLDLDDGEDTVDTGVVFDAEGGASCAPAGTTCDGSVAVVCDAQGEETRVDCAGAETCPDDPFGCACVTGEGCLPRVCEPDQLACDDDDVVECDSHGLETTFVRTCDAGTVCLGGACLAEDCDAEDYPLCVDDVLVGCSQAGEAEILEDCALTGARCDPELDACRCGAGPGCEETETCSDAETGDCLCGSVICDEGETCEGDDTCRCGEGVLDCLNDGTCDEGVCICPAGTYGVDCAACMCQNGAACDDNATGGGTGECTCAEGFWGPLCADACPGGSGVRQCNGNGTCDDGSDGDGTCDCSAGFYGSDCAGVCACENGATCLDGALGDGSCECVGGFWGERCEKVCDCSGAACDQDTGECGACLPGYYGDSCLPCPPGAGETPCNGHGTCSDGSEGNGECDCTGGWAGPACADCGVTWQLPDCDECVVGWDITDDCASCAEGYAGNNCQYSDAITCNGGGDAQDDGSCICGTGFAGDNCEYSDAVTCNGGGDAQDDGSCICGQGYAGDHCEYSDAVTCNGNGEAQDDGSCECDSTHWGSDCSMECGCDDDQLCNEFGQCSQRDFRVQRGQCRLAPGVQTLTLSASVESDSCSPGSFEAIGTDNPAFIRIVGTWLTAMGQTTGNPSHNNTDNWMVWVESGDLSSGSVDFERYATSGDTVFTWEIIEYVGASDGPNAIRIRPQAVDRVVITNHSQSISGTEIDDAGDAIDDDDVVVFITGQGSNEDGSTSGNFGRFTADWVGGTTDQPAFARSEGDPNNSATVSYAVVEFVGANWVVQRVQQTMTDADDWVVETVDIADVGDETRTFFHHQFRGTEGEVCELGAEVWLSATDVLSIDVEDQADNPVLVSVVWIVTNLETEPLLRMQVSHHAGSRPDPGGADEEDIFYFGATGGVPTVPEVPLTSASIMGENGRTTGGTENSSSIPRGSLAMELVDTDADELADDVRITQADKDGERNYRFSVVHWPASFPPPP